MFFLIQLVAPSSSLPRTRQSSSLTSPISFNITVTTGRQQCEKTLLDSICFHLVKGPIRGREGISHVSLKQSLLPAIFTSATHLRSRFPPIPWVEKRRQPVDHRIKALKCPNLSSQCTSGVSSTKTDSSERSSLKRRDDSRAPRKEKTARLRSNIQSTGRE